MIATPEFGNLFVSLFVGISALLFQPLQFAAPICLLLRRQPVRDRFILRSVGCLAGLILLTVLISLISWAGMSGMIPGSIRYIVSFNSYAAYLIAFVPMALFLFDTGVWNALFAVTAGYTTQNLGSGLGEFVRIVVLSATGAQSIVLTVAISNCTVALVTALCFLFFIRKVDSIGRLGDDARGMFGMLFLVILVVVAFDTMIRGLENDGARIEMVLALRIVHAVVCVFVLFAEYEMLYSVRLKGVIAAQELLSAQRKRQYELSRDTIAAVNRRVHDIRHKVARELSEGPSQVDRETLASIVRDISVFDTSVKTGNEALDTILSEKSLGCQRHRVVFSCIADGTSLAHLSAADLYGLFSILIDGAIEAVCDLDDERLRSISLTLRRMGDLALLHVEHYRGARESAGYAAAREIVERYGGTFSTSQSDGAQVLDAMIPIP